MAIPTDVAMVNTDRGLLRPATDCFPCSIVGCSLMVCFVVLFILEVFPEIQYKRENSASFTVSGGMKKTFWLVVTAAI